MNSSAQKKFQTKLNKRRRVCLGLMVLFFLLVGARVFYLQVVESPRLAALARSEYQGTMEILPKRGDIYDRCGTKLAASIEVHSLYACPAQVKDKAQTATRLARILGMDRERILKKLSSKRSFVWIKRKIDPPEKRRVEELKLEGLGFVPESKRVYPHLSLASHVLGFVGVDGHGLEGLELKYEPWLKGKKRTARVLKDARKRIICQSPVPGGDSLEGASLVLTLDKYIQFTVEKELEKVLDKQRARAAMAIMMEPRTGKILAMAVKPSFNPNIFYRYSPARLRNKNVTDCFEPGSTMKVFTASLVLDNRAARPSDIFFCENGSYRIGKHVIHDVHRYGWLSLRRIIQVSSNIGALKLGQKLKASQFYRGLRAFGFGRETGLDLPGETRGILKPPQRWTSVDKASISFGQGISVSPIQLITAFCAIANRGRVMKPYLVERIVDARGREIFRNRPTVIRKAVSAKTAQTMAAILQYVVKEGGTGANAALEGYAVAGKTGTAQKVEPGRKGYASKKYLSSFMGFVPADDPKIALLVMVDEPKGQTYGGLVAAPVFRAICQKVIPYLGIKPNEVFLARKHLERSLKELKEDLEEGGSSRRLKLVDARAGEGMPNVIGMDLRSALSVLDDLNLEIKVSGSGFVVRQYPVPGQPLAGVSRCRIWLSPHKGLES